MGFTEEERRIIRKLRLRKRLRRIAVVSLISLSITFVAVFLFMLSLRAQGRTLSSLFAGEPSVSAPPPAASESQGGSASTRSSSFVELPSLLPSDTEQADATERAMAESSLQRERREAERARRREATGQQPPQSSPPTTPQPDGVYLEPEGESSP